MVLPSKRSESIGTRTILIAIRAPRLSRTANSLVCLSSFSSSSCILVLTCRSFPEIDGQPYCQPHYHEKRGTICGGCQKPIDGMCISALDKKWHQSCFTCTKCKSPLSVSAWFLLLFHPVTSLTLFSGSGHDVGGCSLLWQLRPLPLNG